MDNAIKYGYKFKIFSGYFNKEIVYDKFAIDLYELRLTYPKDNFKNF